MKDRMLKPIKKSPDALQVELEECERLLELNYLLDRQKTVLKNRVKEIKEELERYGTDKVTT